MKFCPKCGNIMLPDKKRGVFVCRKCGYEEPLDPEAASKYKITQKIKHEREDIPVIEQDVATLPKVKIICPKCGNDEAYWWELQTRAGDEPSTIFYRCTKCGYTWRGYE
ncbi:MAG: transcription factor S [Thermococcus sp.]|uniref:Transcription factor S n=1 Tax=Desulfofervidus auxilii TaxID=1621989 RepID=A0A7V1I4K0_DESA2|nr:transcription factor S [Thermococcus sp.]RLF76446.1 MAG: transcription factor S [Thermococci archaeon]HEB74342.1 transcription factor S [Candidatus Desulfofervidus auxilii]MCD6140941.1 transcription factor S [Thermococcus sp.]MCD6143912.1 transcription factor S [Thermococcus sp.]RLF84697.1 MAG: transcription factor S [Thermococci archaeon]